jgi:ABC-2 type transport system permease protein
MLRDDLRGIFYIALKDMRTYYLKPPSVSWGIVFPLAWTLAFYLRNPADFGELVPGLIAMTVLFSTTAAEAVVINFEMRIGAIERLLLAPVSLPSVLMGKVIGGALFGLMMSAIITVSSVMLLGLTPNFFLLALIIIPSLLAFSALGSLLCVTVKEIFEAQTLLNFPRFIMVFLCGVVYPVSAMPEALRYIAYMMPLTYTVEGVRLSISVGLNMIILRDALVLVVFFLIFALSAMKLFAKKVKA